MKTVKTFRGTVRKIRAFSFPGAPVLQRRLETVAWGEVDGHPVTFHASKNAKSIREGDDVLVSGWIEGSFFQAIAYTNLTTGYSYHPPYRVAVGAMGACGAIAAAALIFLPAASAAVAVAVLGALAAILAGGKARHADRTGEPGRAGSPARRRCRRESAGEQHLSAWRALRRHERPSRRASCASGHRGLVCPLGRTRRAEAIPACLPDAEGTGARNGDRGSA